MSRPEKGFTLIEMLLVVSFVFLTSVAILSTFSQSVRLFERLSLLKSEESLAFFFERLTHDLKNGTSETDTPWFASTDTLSFPAFDWSSMPGAALEAVLPSRVCYRFDAAGRRVTRSVDYFPYGGKDADRMETVARDVAAVRFSASAEAGPPALVTVTVDLDGDGACVLRKDIAIPIATAPVRA